MIYLYYIVAISFLIVSAGDRPLHASEFEKDESGDIVIYIDNVRNQRGSLLISLFNSPEGYPEEWETAFRYRVISAAGFSGKVRFEDIPYGSYAFAVVHDENENLKLDRNILGIPREGYAFSNNARARFGPPGYDAAVFSLSSPEIKQHIHFIY